jgi:hypothetical protein
VKDSCCDVKQQITHLLITIAYNTAGTFVFTFELSIVELTKASA